MINFVCRSHYAMYDIDYLDQFVITQTRSVDYKKISGQVLKETMV